MQGLVEASREARNRVVGHLEEILFLVELLRGAAEYLEEEDTLAILLSLAAGQLRDSQVERLDFQIQVLSRKFAKCRLELREPFRDPRSSHLPPSRAVRYVGPI